MSSAEDLRGYLGRLLGWTNTSAIDHALRSIELTREHRAQLVLCGHGDLVPLAYGQHRRALGADTPSSCAILVGVIRLHRYDRRRRVTLVIGVDERRPDRRQAVATAPVTRLPPGAISVAPAYRS
jgi:hypothetical protein